MLGRDVCKRCVSMSLSVTAYSTLICPLWRDDDIAAIPPLQYFIPTLLDSPLSLSQ